MRSTLHRTLAGVAALALLGACKDSMTVGDLNNVSSSQIAGGLNRSSVGLLVTGLLNQDRQSAGSRYVVFSETMARDIYRLDPAESRFITELLGVAPDPGGFVGASVWTDYWVTVRTANTILDNLSTAKDLSTQEQAATRGFVRTFKALAYWRALEMRDTLGLPIDVDQPIEAAPATLRCKSNVLAFISSLLDSAATDLNQGGSAFPFSLPGGFSSNGTFNTPSTFLKFNRGLAGKVEVYRGLDRQKPDPSAFTRAIADFNQSFLSLQPADTALGVYYTYSTAPGEFANPIFDPNIYLNPAVGDSIQANDKRASKIQTLSTAASRNGVTTKYRSSLTTTTIAGNATRPLPILRNTELVLLRAQAEIGVNDLVSATRDINYARVNEGGLPTYSTFTSQAAAINALLYEKRYSLLLTGAQRLVDLRAYGRLNATYLKKETSSDVFTAALPIPSGEANARNNSLTPVCQ